MKRIIYMTGLVTIALFGLQACMEDSIVHYDGPTLTYFSTENAMFFIQDEPNQVYNIRIGTTVASDKNRTVNLSLTSSTAQKGVQYDYDATSVTIPAGQYVADLPIKGLYSGYAAGNVDTLVVKIITEEIDSSAFKQTFTLIMRKYCPVVLDDLYGYYDAVETNTGSGASYSYEMAVLPNPNGGDTLVLRNLWETEGAPGYQDIKIAIDYSDPTSFTTNIAPDRQNLYVHSSYGQLWVQPVQKGSFSSCDRTISVYYTCRVGAGSFGNFRNDMVWTAPLED